MGSDYSCVVSNENNGPDETPTLRSPFASEFARERLMTRFPDLPNIGTIYELFQHSLHIGPDVPLYGYRAFENGQFLDHFNYVSRQQIANFRDSVGAFLIKEKIPFQGNIGILSYNRVEWVVVQHACFAYGFIPVPIYDTFGWENIKYIIKYSTLTHIFIISTRLQRLLQEIEEDSPVKVFIVIDAEEHPYNNSFIDFSKCPAYVQKIRIVKYSDIIQITERFSHRPPTPDTPAAIMYTSGTTSFPKGCIIAHSNYIATAACFSTIVYPFSGEDKMLSYLPLAHVYEAVIHVVALKIVGICIGFYSGSIPRLIDEVKIFHPTIFNGVPRVFERIYDEIQNQINKRSLIVRSALKLAFSVKSFLEYKCHLRHVPILDSAFSQIQAALGRNVKLLIAGGAPMKSELQNFMRIMCNAAFIQGYGLTESAAGTAVQIWTDLRNDNIGILLPCTEAKIRSIPEMGYYAKDFSGELYIRGATNFHGYYKNEEATKAVVDERGWFKTGDIFKLTQTKQLSIVGRVKELVKLSQGEYISLPKLQSVYSKTNGIKQIYIHAGRFSRYLTALVIMKKENENETEEEIIKKLNDVATKEQLNGFERIKFVSKVKEEFTMENGMLTPSLKLCGYKICNRYATEIADLDAKSI